MRAGQTSVSNSCTTVSPPSVEVERLRRIDAIIFELAWLPPCPLPRPAGRLSVPAFDGTDAPRPLPREAVGVCRSDPPLPRPPLPPRFANPDGFEPRETPRRSKTETGCAFPLPKLLGLSLAIRSSRELSSLSIAPTGESSALSPSPSPSHLCSCQRCQGRLLRGVEGEREKRRGLCRQASDRWPTQCHLVSGWAARG